MAGFASSLLIFAMVQMLGNGGWIFNRARSFVLWNVSVVAYVVLMTISGRREGFDPRHSPSFREPLRNILYALRLVSGILMLVASLDWLIDATTLLRERVVAADEIRMEKTA